MALIPSFFQLQLKFRPQTCFLKLWSVPSSHSNIEKSSFFDINIFLDVDLLEKIIVTKVRLCWLKNISTFYRTGFETGFELKHKNIFGAGNKKLASAETFWHELLAWKD